MATFYLDPQGGNDASDGTTFANRWNTWSAGATAARIAPNDTIRVKQSPSPTSLGVNGTWTTAPTLTGLAATVAITSSTNATPIVVTKSGHGLSSGDTVIISGHTTNTNANGIWEITVVDANTFSLQNADGTNSVGNGVGGATGTYRLVNNCRVKLATAVTKSIALYGNQGSATKANWTASANVTCTNLTTDFKEGFSSQQIAVAAGFTTGLAAYFALPAGATDFSGYRQITFWVKQTVGTLGAAGSWTISLCSDTAGATPVDTFNGPLVAALNQWMPITVDKGATLGASIQSIAFNIVTDNGAQTFLFDNFVASKDSTANDSLSLVSLIGKNDGVAGGSWACIQSINSTRVMLDKSVNTVPTLTTVQRGYVGVSETVTAYKRETIKWPMATSGGTVIQAGQDSGTNGSPITYSGGWNSTDMSTQVAETWIDGQNGLGTFFGDQTNFVNFDKISFVRMNLGWNTTFGYKRSWTNMHCLSMSGNGATFAQGSNITVQGIFNYNGGSGIVMTACDYSTNLDIVAHSNTTHGFQLDSRNCVAQNVVAKNNAGGYGMMFGLGENCLINNLITDGNSVFGAVGTGGVNFGGGGKYNYLYNASITETVEFGNGGNDSVYGSRRFISENHDGVAGYTLINCGSPGKIETEDTVRHTASGQAWKISVQSALVTTTNPLDFEIARIAVKASTLVTVKAWMRRTNTGLTHRLVLKGGQVGLGASDVTSAMTAAADTWEEITITFTPVVAGVVIITTESYGGTTYSGYVDDMTISQA